MRVVLFSGRGDSSDAVFAYLKEHHELVGVVIDGPSSRKLMVKRRIKKLGYVTVFLQALFQKGIVPLLMKFSKKRQAELWATIKTESVASFKNKLTPTTINDDEVIDYVKKCNADIIIVNGTRIIKKKIINGVHLPMVNIHVGITPKYRGVHGGYWALVKQDKEHCGVTAHLIDAGIDTGGVISQRTIEITDRDNFCTYPILQLQAGLLCIEDAMQQVKNADIKIIKNNLESKLYYHPTITTYIYHRLFFGVK
ncbi:MAG: formyl transferase [Flavobacteriaceae bacterium]|nr:MAG: formyl transferase [Flavobacteriaceae bacterium]